MITISKTHQSRYDFSDQVISPTQRPLPDTTQHSKEKTSMPSARFETKISANEETQTYVFDRAATVISQNWL